jgi:Ser/Thr protein kinase RdoA (MazF antagonist)
MPPFFPASYSTLSATALAELIRERYSGDVTGCTLLVRGVGDTYLIEDGDRHILRVYRSSHRSLTHIQAELELLLDLRRAGVSVSYPLVDREGGLIQVLEGVEGPRYAVLFTYAPGLVVSVPDGPQLRALGVEMARFHNVSARYTDGSRRWTYDADTTLYEPLRRLAPYFEGYPEGYDWLKKAAAAVTERLQKTDTQHFSRGYCHFDFLPKNFHFSGDKVTLFDFDFLGYGWLVNDVMSFWQHLQVEVYVGRMAQEAADEAYQRFIAAYRTERALSEEELGTVPYLMLGFWVFYMGFHTQHDQFLSYLQTASLRTRTTALKAMMEKYTDGYTL